MTYAQFIVAGGVGLVVATVSVIAMIVHREGQARWGTPRWLSWSMHTVLVAWVAYGLTPFIAAGGGS